MRGLYTKITLLVGSVLLVAMVVILALVYVTKNREIEQQGIARAETLNRLAFEALYASMRQGGGREGNLRVIERLREMGAFTQLRVVKGDPVARQFGRSPDEMPQDELEWRALQGEEVRQIRWKNGYRVIRYVTPLRVEPECQRCHQAAVGEINGAISAEISLQSYEIAWRRERNILLLGLAGGMCALAGVIFVGLRRLILRPLQEIHRGVAAIAEGNLEHRLDVRTGDELEVLAEEFNRMAARLQASYTYLEDKVAERTRELRILNQIAATVNRSLDLDKTLPEVLRQVMDLVGADAADIRVLDGNELRIRASYGLPADLLRQESRIPVGYCLCGLAAQRMQSEGATLGTAVANPLPCLHSSDLASSLSVPVMVEGRVVGVIHVASARAAAFDRHHQEVLVAVGQHVGLALEKARLLEQERRQRQLAETLQQASRTLNASLDLETVLHTLLEQLAQVLTIDVGLILLREGDSLRVAAVRGRAGLATERLLGYKLPIDANASFERAIRTKVPVTSCGPGRRFPFAGGVVSVEDVGWCLVVPLLKGNEAIGLLALEQLDHCYDTEEAPRIAMAFANQAVVAIENARLYAEVKALNEELEARVTERTRELEEARQMLARQAEQLRHLLNKTIRIQEEERERIAHELHDGVTQLLMGALFELQAAKLTVDTQPHVAREKLQSAQEILKQAKVEMRRLIYDLHPAVLSQSGLVPALEAYLREFEAYTGISCKLDVEGSPARLTPEQERAVYRIVQEALHNVAQHAQATRVRVAVAFGADALCVHIEDNGRGFDADRVWHTARPHLGLVSMRERAQAVGGYLDIHSQPGQGTRVVVRIPASYQGASYAARSRVDCG